MAAVIQAHQPKFVCQGTLVLLGPDQVTRTEAMDEQNQLAVGLAVFVYGESSPPIIVCMGMCPPLLLLVVGCKG
jgi:hypothetical protein